MTSIYLCIIPTTLGRQSFRLYVTGLQSSKEHSRKQHMQGSAVNCYRVVLSFYSEMQTTVPASHITLEINNLCKSHATVLLHFTKNKQK